MTNIKTVIVIEGSKVSSMFIAHVLKTVSLNVVVPIYSIQEYKEKMRNSQLSPDLICIDYTLPDGVGDEIINFNQNRGIKSPAVVLTNSYKLVDLFVMQDSNSRCIANKENPGKIQELISKILNKNNKGKHFGASICNMLLRFELDAVKLTYNEKKVFKLLISIFSVAEIADLMHIENRAVYRKQQFINSKLGENVTKRYCTNYLYV